MYPPAHTHEVKGTEQVLRFSFPKVLQQLYTEVANGGFGPGYGLIGLDTGMPDYTGLALAQAYFQARQPDAQPSSTVWPALLLLLCHWGCGIYSCVDCSTPDLSVLRFDPNKLNSEPQRGRAFSPEATSLTIWMTRWVNDEDLWDSFESQ